jgi:2-methylcitrate dehydratase PrpD
MDPICKLAQHVIDTKYEDLPKEAVEAVKIATLDILGCLIAGFGDAEKEVGLIKDWGGKPEAPVYLYGGRIPVANAVFLNSCMAYAIDWECSVVFHDFVGTIVTGMSMGDFLGNVRGKDFITAIAVGVDVAGRIADSGGYKRDNFHCFCPTGTCDIFAEAAIAGKLLGLDTEGMLNALGIVYGRCGTTHAPASDKAEAVRLQNGLSARNGVESALLAQRGIRGARNVLEGRHGWYEAFTIDKSKINRDELLEDLGEKWVVERLLCSGLKLYCAHATTFPLVHAALKLVAEYNIDFKNISRITAETSPHVNSISGHPLTYGLCGDPVRAEAQFSQPYVIADAIVRGGIKPEHFTKEAMLDQDVVELAVKVIPVANHSLDGKIARLEIEMYDGRQYSAAFSKADLPVRSVSEVVDKFREAVATEPGVLPKANIDQIIELSDRLETLDNMTELSKLLLPTGEKS